MTDTAFNTNMKKVGGELVPSWDGSPEEWEDYQVRSGIYCRGTDRWKIGQRISNLIQSLTGKAWDSIMNLSEKERENLQVDLESFHTYLKSSCLPTAIPELGRRFREWLKFRRVRKETMRTFIRRYHLQLNKLEGSMRLVDQRSPKLRKLQKAINLQKTILKRDPEFRKTLKPNSETGSVASSSHQSKLSNSTKASKKSEKSQKPIPPRSWINNSRKKSSQPSYYPDDDDEWWDEEEESEEEEKVSESDYAHLLTEDEGAPSETYPKKPPSKTPSHASYKGHSSWGLVA